jgi:cobalt/nickel transport system permease protein
MWVPGLAVAAAVLIAAAIVLRVPSKTVIRRMLVAEPFAVAIAIMALFQPGGTRLFLIMLSKSTICLFCMVLLGVTTSFPEVLDSLKRLRVPGLLITTLALSYRYLFVLVEEAERMKRARLSRSFRTGRLHAWRVLASIISELFVRAADRAERIYSAMCARGWRT